MVVFRFSAKHFFVFAFLTGLLLGCYDTKKEQVLHVAASANTQFAMKKILQKFTKTTGIRCELIVGSSGKHTAQILQGAPYHVFLSADQKYPQFIYENGLASEPPVTYGYGQLVLWTTNKKIEAKIADIINDKVQRIAIPDPDLAPYGEAAMDVLHYYQIYENVKPKLVFAESVSQVNHFVLTGAVELGFTSLSTVIAKDTKDKGRWLQVPSISYKPIAQDAVLITKNNTEIEASKKFMEFIISDEAGKILKNFGYLLPDSL